ncbi:MAG: hypothetical protein M3Y82_13985 [Verrucomicrobiota bacterium]|nr:hypothetical protein [Verrucomicrobiota bacterium]
MPSEKNNQTILVCFAVSQEAAPFRRFISARQENIQILLTGIGQKNAEKTLRQKLETLRPEMVLSCGFAGGLNPDFSVGQVIFSADSNFPLTSRWLSAGAVPARFYFSNRIITTAEEKKSLRQSTGADAVEMESQIIRKLCGEQNIPSATLRVISDAAHENLPLDFNLLLTPEYHLHYGKLMRAILCSPKKINGLLRLQRQTKMAAEKLSAVLQTIFVKE